MATFVPHTKWLQRQLNGNGVDLDAAAVLKGAFITSSWTPAAATDDDASTGGIRTNEVSGTGYTAGGITLTNPWVTLDSAYIEFGFDDVTIAQNAGGATNCRYFLVYSTADDMSVGHLDLGGDKGWVNGPLTVDVDPANGVVRINSAA